MDKSDYSNYFNELNELWVRFEILEDYEKIVNDIQSGLPDKIFNQIL